MTIPESAALQTIESLAAHNIRLAAQVAALTRQAAEDRHTIERLREILARLLNEYDRGPGQTCYWPELAVTVGEAREEMRQ